MSNNKGGGIFRVFGGSSKGAAKTKTAQTPQEAIQQLRDVEDVLNKKVEHLEAKINEETAIARRDARTNKRNALNALKRKKRLEKTLQQIDGTLTTLEYQREALQNASMNGQAFNALKSATSALKNVHKELDVDSVQDIMDELAEQHELSNEIANAISSPVGFGAEIDEFELENELAALEQEALSKEMAQIDLPTVPAHPIPTYNQPATASSSKAKNDQLAELERWAS
jgi:charged multivesicular body protein 4